MEQVTIGKIIEPGQHRDAIHIAIFPAIAGESLKPGTPVKFTNTNGKQVMKSDRKSSIGIVDPFLTKDVKAGEHFYMFMYPNTIQGLRHNWSHPQVEDDREVPKDNVFHLIKTAESRKWLEEFADQYQTDYNELMATAKEHIRNGSGYIHLSGIDTPYEMMEEFWKHFEIVEDVTVPKDMQGTIFTCSC